MGQRVQTNENRIRVADLCVLRPTVGEDIVRTPPVLCLEVVATNDSLASIRDRFDYLFMGVENAPAWVTMESAAYQIMLRLNSS